MISLMHVNNLLVYHRLHSVKLNWNLSNIIGKGRIQVQGYILLARQKGEAEISA